MFETNTRFALFLLAALFVLCCFSCDQAPLFDVDEAIRQQQKRPWKVGTLRALEVHSLAAIVSRNVAAAPHEDCRLTVADGGFSYHFDLELKRLRADRTLSSWKERRTFEVDTEGDLRLSARGEFLTSIGMRGERRWERRLTGNREFVSDGRDQLFYVREPDRNALETLRAHGPGSLDSLLSAVSDGWKPRGDGSFSPGSSRLTCGPFPGERAENSSGWIPRFRSVSRLMEATLEGPTPQRPDGRELRATLALSDGSVLELYFRDQIGHFEGEIEPPEAGRVRAVLRDRSLRRSWDVLGSLSEAGALDVQEVAESDRRVRPKDELH